MIEMTLSQNQSSNSYNHAISKILIYGLGLVFIIIVAADLWLLITDLFTAAVSM
jgi:hypothetical protein